MISAIASRACAAVGLALALSPLPASAQDWVSSMMQTTTDNMTYHALTTAGVASMCAYDGVCEESPDARGGGDVRINWLEAAEAAETVDVQPVNTSYAPDPSVSETVKAEFLRQAAERDPAAADALRAEMARSDFVQEYAKAVQEYGFSTHDMADAVTAYWVMGWMLANQIGPDEPAGPKREEVLAVREQVRAAMALNPAVRDMSATEMQKTTESLILSFVVNAVIFNTVSRPENAGQFNRVSEATRQGMMNFLGVDLTGIDLTERGFVKRG